MSIDQLKPTPIRLEIYVVEHRTAGVDVHVAPFLCYEEALKATVRWAFAMPIYAEITDDAREALWSTGAYSDSNDDRERFILEYNRVVGYAAFYIHVATLEI